MRSMIKTKKMMKKSNASKIEEISKKIEESSKKIEKV